jgi:hypothetical protein
MIDRVRPQSGTVVHGDSAYASASPPCEAPGSVAVSRPIGRTSAWRMAGAFPRT